jgi:hypothetical protein
MVRLDKKTSISRYCLGRRWVRTTFSIVRRVFYIVLIFVLFNSFYHADAPPNGSGATSTVSTEINYFRLQLLPSWGTWQLDNHALTAVPTPNTGIPDGIAPLAVTRGRHELRWLGAPFPTLTCSFVVPYQAKQPGQTCQITRLATAAQDESFLLSFPTQLSFQMLSQEQQEKLRAATQAYLSTLTSTTSVAPGERYRYTPTTPIRQATQPMQATLSFVLDTSTSGVADCQGYRFGDGCSYPATGEDCRLFCTIQWGDGDGYHYWNIAVVTRPTWSYTTATAGQSASKHVSTVQMQGAQQITSLRIDWRDNQWQVGTHQWGDSYYDDPNCESTIYRISTSISSYSATSSTATAQKYPIWNFTSGRDRALGCLVTNKGTDTVIIERFNVLQAINLATQQRYPTLPLINGNGERVAQEILQNVAFVS